MNGEVGAGEGHGLDYGRGDTMENSTGGGGAIGSGTGTDDEKDRDNDGGDGHILGVKHGIS